MTGELMKFMDSQPVPPVLDQILQKRSPGICMLIPQGLLVFRLVRSPKASRQLELAPEGLVRTLEGAQSLLVVM